MWAILVIGQVRTLKKTSKFFNNIPGDIFAVLQDDEQRNDQLVKESFGDRLKSLVWISKSSSEFEKVKKETKERLQGRVSDEILNYLTERSGSIIEYYHLYLGEKLISKYEETNECKYEYVFKTRCDLVWNEKIDPNMLNLNPNPILDVLHILEERKERILSLFMSTLMSPRLIPICIETPDSYWSEDGEKQIIREEVKDVVSFLKEGNYILTFRKNLAYLVRRDKFKSISSFGINYGIYVTNSEYWYNAETQFRMACFASGLSVFDFHSPLEERFMYSTGLNENGDPIEPECLFFIVRS